MTCPAALYHARMSAQPLILASASPQRKALLEQLGRPFEVRASPFAEPESRPAGVGGRAWAAALAYFKARAVADSAGGACVLGADTVVACGGELLGKPRDLAAARRMLELQAGRACDVITGVALLRSGGSRQIALAVTRVWMRSDRRELERYLESGDWQGKAGAYGIQTVGDRLVERIEGSFSNVVGLPLELVARLLAQTPFSA